MSGGTPRAIGPGLLALGLWLAPSLARACAVCMGGQEEESQLAFILMTVFMSALPLVMIGSIAWFIRRAYREREARSQARVEGTAPGIGPSR